MPSVYRAEGGGSRFAIGGRLAQGGYAALHCPLEDESEEAARCRNAERASFSGM